MKLQHVRLQRLDDRIEPGVVGIDRERDFLRPAAHALSQQARRLERDVPRRGLKKYEADHVGALVERDIKGLRRREAAYFDDQRHFLLLAGLFYMAAPGLSRAGRGV